MRKRLAAMICMAPMAAFAANGDYEQTINRIVDEGLNRSQLPETAAYLCDRIGGRLTNSPQMRIAEKWAQERFRSWGLQNVRTEGFEFGRGWSIESSSVRMLSPRVQTLRAIPIAWTPATNGAISAPIIVAPIARDRDFEKWRGKLRGRIVLITRPDDGSELDKAPFHRYSDEELAKLDEYQQPVESASEQGKRLKRAKFELRKDAFLAAEGALAWVRESNRDGGLLHGTGGLYKVGETPVLPAVELAAEDYRKLARLAKTDAVPTLEINSQVKFNDEDVNAYNIFAEIPGTDPKAGYVMAGAHFDSWVAADGAGDNGAGSVSIMEAARILATLKVKPKRTIRFALWSGEEQGLLGSLAYVEKHLAIRAPATDPELAKYDPRYTWRLRWPITPGPDYQKLAAYFNIDNGSGKFRGIYTEGNVAVVPIFKEWLTPFASMGASKVVAKPTGSTDHVYMQAVGIPAFQFIQDPLDYGSRIHHTSLDSYDHLKIPDLKQASVILASLLLMSADRDQPLPRTPLPQKPRDSDPFAYPEDDE
jgi:carboxypeptidase Q